MAFFIGLISFTLFIWLISKIFKENSFQNFWIAGRVGARIMFVMIGVMHLVKPEALAYMVEDLLPFATELVVISGVTEVLFGLGLLWNKTRTISAWLLIIQLILMFPANINVAVNNLAAPGGLPAAAWYTWSRLLFQPVYIYWVYKAANLDLKSILPTKKEEVLI
ncbi:DoxX family protein [Chondrinema litorale]|uniref:DoxX family protein n=1 Tax=Chondrinema litorale TaxID=2994555 RepID=UPI002543CF44|nr:hypothetical protein [Chondrinema litorale]UZR96969.1 hypothetical protein OQ292_23000 [Chondrinema litorale]